MTTPTPGSQSATRVPCYCALCVSRCGAIAVREKGRFVALEPDPTHPTGAALCAKGRAAPELVQHPDRLRRPLRRTRPKGDPDPGWEPIGWDEALDEAAARLRRIAEESGPESVAFSCVSPSTSASDDALVWIERLMNAFGSPNLCAAMELCGWGRYLAPLYTFGAPVPGSYMPDLDHAGCILYWGYNPNLARLSHATATAAAQRRGARLIVVDPRRTGPARRADLWLQVRPGTDGALALGIANVMIERGWYDRAFLRDHTNGPLLVRDGDGRLLREGDLSVDGASRRYLAMDSEGERLLPYDPATRRFASPEPSAGPALRVRREVETASGPLRVASAFERVAALCQRYPPERVETITGVGASQVEEAARLLWEARPTAYYAWSGVEMQSGSTQVSRAIGQLYSLTGCLDAPGGNVLFASVPSADLSGRELLPETQRAKTLGRDERPLGPARWQFVTTRDLYRAILEREPYAVRGLVGFGSNLLLSHADGRRGRAALAALDFYVHADLFPSPTAELADLLLPVASAFEREALRLGFEVSAEAQAHVQLRQRVAEPPGEARSDTAIVFDLARRLGLGERFWQGDREAATRARLAPSGLTLEDLRAAPGGLRVPLETRFRKFAEEDAAGRPVGFHTPTGRIELYSEVLLEGGAPPLPDYEPPRVGPTTRPGLAARYPLVLTCAKHRLFCESQHRGLPSLRRKARDPELEIHPDTAAARGIAPGDWVIVETPEGRVRARARLVASLDPGVVSGQHGWWEACEEIGASGYDPFGPDGANYNLLIGDEAVDPVSGSVPHRAYLCEVRPAG